MRLSQGVGDQPPVPFPVPGRSERQPAWVRCRGPFPGQSGTGRAGGLRCPLSRAPRIGPGAGAGYRPQPHGHRHPREPVVVGCAGQRPVPAATPAISISAGMSRIRICGTRCWCRSWAPSSNAACRRERFSCAAGARKSIVGYFDHELPVSAASLMELQRAAGAASGAPLSTRRDENRPDRCCGGSWCGARPVAGRRRRERPWMTSLKRINSEPRLPETVSRPAALPVGLLAPCPPGVELSPFFRHPSSGRHPRRRRGGVCRRPRNGVALGAGGTGRRFAHRSPGRSAGPHRLPAAVAQRSAGDLDCG